MPTEVIMPKVDMDMQTGRIAAWHVGDGDSVNKGDPLFDIETDKAAMEVESPAEGTIRHIAVEAGVDVPIGKAVAWIYGEGETTGAPPSAEAPEVGHADPPESDQQRRGAAEAGGEDSPVAVSAATAARIRATPAARRIARLGDHDLAAIKGSGPRGRIQRADVEDRAAKLRPDGDGPTARSAVSEAQDDWQEPEGPLYILRRGEGEAAPIVLVHGFAVDAYGWAALDPFLPGDRRRLAIELPGHGRSPRRHIGSFRVLARRLVEAFDSLDLERAHLVGHSLGGALALAIADLRPKSVASLALIAPAGLGPQIDGRTLAGITHATRSESLAPWLKRLTADPDAISWDFVKAAMLARSNPAMRAAQADMLETLFPDATQSFDLTAALCRLEAPAKIVWGRRDRILPWRHALAAPGHVALHLMRDVGHMPQIEAPAALGRLLTGLVTEAEAGRSA